MSYSASGEVATTVVVDRLRTVRRVSPGACPPRTGGRSLSRVGSGPLAVLDRGYAYFYEKALLVRPKRADDKWKGEYPLLSTSSI
jgi:hypothetical protein